MTAFVYLLALIGVVAVLAVVGVWLLIPQDSTDVDLRDRLEPYTGHPRGNVRLHAEPDSDCDACTGLDRGAF